MFFVFCFFFILCHSICGDKSLRVYFTNGENLSEVIFVHKWHKYWSISFPEIKLFRLLHNVCSTRTVTMDPTSSYEFATSWSQPSLKHNFWLLYSDIKLEKIICVIQKLGKYNTKNCRASSLFPCPPTSLHFVPGLLTDAMLKIKQKSQFLCKPLLWLF